MKPAGAFPLTFSLLIFGVSAPFHAWRKLVFVPLFSSFFLQGQTVLDIHK